MHEVEMFLQKLPTYLFVYVVGGGTRCIHSDITNISTLICRSP